MMWKWLVCSKNKNMKTLRAGAFWENSHWFLIIMIYIKWIFIIRIFTVVLLPEPKTESSCLSSSKHNACHGKMVSILPGCMKEHEITSALQMETWGQEHHNLHRAIAKQLWSLSPAFTWGLAKLEHFSMRMAMWPQLQSQRLRFTSWIAYNNGMLGYLGCIHCRGCFLFKNRKKRLFPTGISNRGRIWGLDLFCALASDHLSSHTAHFWLQQYAGINGFHGSGAIWLLSPSPDDAHLAVSAASQPVGTEALLASSCWDLSWMLCKVFFKSGLQGLRTSSLAVRFPSAASHPGCMGCCSQMGSVQLMAGFSWLRMPAVGDSGPSLVGSHVKQVSFDLAAFIIPRQNKTGGFLAWVL